MRKARVRIVADGQPHGTRVYEAESGVQIRATAIRFEHDVRRGPRTPEIRIEAEMPIAELEGEATITEHCPLCGRAAEDPPSAEALDALTAVAFGAGRWPVEAGPLEMWR